VVVIPTNRPMVRDDLPDVVFKTEREKFNAAVEEIKERHETGQPILVGTISIEDSEKLARKLKKQGVKHNVLNAKQHEREAEIVAQAGRLGAVTISTNMAGRGTDIVLGGNPEMLALAKCQGDKEHPEFQARFDDFEEICAAEREDVVAAGGLHILGTERHESRRIDNQLRGRAGRQGDAGSTQFLLSLEDDLLRIFESERVKQWWDRVGVEEGEAIENKLLTRVIENAQKKVEARNFDIRKHLLDYDDVMNKQRQAFYGRRRDAMMAESIHAEILDMLEGAVFDFIQVHWPEKGTPEDETIAEMATALHQQFGVEFDPQRPPLRIDGKLPSDRDALAREIHDRLLAALEEKKKHCDSLAEQHASIGYPRFEQVERDFLLQILDAQWKDHLHSMDGLRESIGFRGYGQKDPKLEYQREGFALFEEMQKRVDDQMLDVVFKVQLRDPSDEPAPAPRVPAGPPPGPQVGPRREMPPEAQAGGAKPAAKVGRNDPCPCGSGRKYKKCHGAAA
jgi:preprotein translocase subunit SecA